MADDDLLTRLKKIEDYCAILNLIASHPPIVDSGSGDDMERIWTADGVFDYGTFDRRELGPAEYRDHLNNKSAEPIAAGMAHCSSLPVIRIEGDDASALSYLQLVIPDPEGRSISFPHHGASRGFTIFRTVVNAWRMKRQKEGWRISARISRTVGEPPAVDLLSRSLAVLP